MRTHKKAGRNLSYIQIFGERNSGTNHLRRLVQESMKEPLNFLGSYGSKNKPNNTTRRFGYKHYYARQEKLANDQKEALFLVIYKNPYTWIRSTMVKPYHFRDDLEGKRIEDLPNLLLTGKNVHGNLIPDVHPKTGEATTIFELRRHKIKNWEGLIDHVDSAVFLTYEELLLRPTQIIQEIIDNFPSLFHSSTAPEYKTENKYLEKYVNPEPFTDSEMGVMNAHIPWEVEANIGYQKNNLFIST
ncbi:hypothetical protein [Flexibacterium corallicola]|uniref:hypothetical protein n=1 Tax=Flexibacterium corallicola TaxID=3037259 RepID=UPI00286F52E5|nr:hypothetical protein [Pseudovibrio sp. M1P-2-3]